MSEGTSHILIHAFIGGCECSQGKSLNAIKGRLLALFGDRLTIVILSLKNIKERDWNEEQFIHWLAAADIYLIMCHPHQGTQRFWNSPKLYALLQVELVNRIGLEALGEGTPALAGTSTRNFCSGLSAPLAMQLEQ